MNITPLSGGPSPEEKISPAIKRETPSDSLAETTMQPAEKTVDIITIGNVNIEVPVLPRGGEGLSVSKMMDILSAITLISKEVGLQIQESNAKINQLRLQAWQLVSETLSRDISERLQLINELRQRDPDVNTAIGLINQDTYTSLTKNIQEYNSRVKELNERIDIINNSVELTQTIKDILQKLGVPNPPANKLPYFQQLPEPLAPNPIPSSSQLEAYNTKIRAMNLFISEMLPTINALTTPAIGVKQLPELYYREFMTPTQIANLFNMNDLLQTIATIVGASQSSISMIEQSVEEEKREVKRKKKQKATEEAATISTTVRASTPGSIVSPEPTLSPAKVGQILRELLTRDEIVRELKNLLEESALFSGMKSTIILTSQMKEDALIQKRLSLDLSEELLALSNNDELLLNSASAMLSKTTGLKDADALLLQDLLTSLAFYQKVLFLFMAAMTNSSMHIPISSGVADHLQKMNVPSEKITAATACIEELFTPPYTLSSVPKNLIPRIFEPYHPTTQFALFNEIEKLVGPKGKNQLGQEIGRLLGSIGFPATSLLELEKHLQAGNSLGNAIATTLDNLPHAFISNLGIESRPLSRTEQNHFDKVLSSLTMLSQNDKVSLCIAIGNRAISGEQAADILRALLLFQKRDTSIASSEIVIQAFRNDTDRKLIRKHDEIQERIQEAFEKLTTKQDDRKFMQKVMRDFAKTIERQKEFHVFALNFLLDPANVLVKNFSILTAERSPEGKGPTIFQG